MTTVEFRTACQLGLGIPLEILRGVTHCFAGHPIDQYGLHFTTTACGSRSRDPVRTGAWRTKRHDLIRDELGRIAQQCGVRVELERSGLPGIPNPATRCDLVLYDFPEKERHTVIDVVIKGIFGSDGNLSSHLNSRSPPGTMAIRGEADKRAIYAELIPPYVFAPVAFEDFGRSGHATDVLLESLAKLRTSQILGTNALLQTARTIRYLSALSVPSSSTAGVGASLSSSP